MNTKIYPIAHWNKGDRVRRREYDYKTGTARAVIFPEVGVVRSTSDFYGVEVYWTKRRAVTRHDIDIIPA